MSHEVIPPSIEDLKAIGIDVPTEGKVVVDIFTEWCSPCKMIAPILHALKDDGKISLVQEDLDKNPDLVEKFHVHSIPTLLFFKNGNRIGSVPRKTFEISLVKFFAEKGEGATIKMAKDGTEIDDLSSYNLKIIQYAVKDGVMIGFLGEEILRKVIDEM